MSEWKPGDVALVCNEHGIWNVAICTLRASHDGWWWRFGVADSWLPVTANARPLVLLDPESNDDVDRLADALSEYVGEQAALRELADPTPPRIDEPGTWGVVEASCVHRAERVKWIHHEDGNWWPAEFYGDVKARVDKGRDPRLPDDWDSLVDPVLVREGVPE